MPADCPPCRRGLSGDRGPFSWAGGLANRGIGAAGTASADPSENHGERELSKAASLFGGFSLEYALPLTFHYFGSNFLLVESFQ